MGEFCFERSDSRNTMGILRNHLHKRRATGGKRAPIRNKRKFELARPAAMTKLGAHRIHPVRCRGGMIKKRALRLDSGNFSWGSESIAKKTRIIDTVYNPCNNELVRTKTLVKTPSSSLTELHSDNGTSPTTPPLLDGRRELSFLRRRPLMNKKRSNKTALKYKERQKTAAVEHALEDQFMTGRVLAAISSRPGQSGRADGYILEGKELEFYLRKIKAKKGNK